MALFIPAERPAPDAARVTAPPLTLPSADPTAETTTMPALPNPIKPIE
ncbi:hypothetical protein J8F10_08395 [Gemmata sp. G18]|uniref:Uncharacterized protein n=1 Tax=Gemmata palustris TaxID=2822762 RepID=A0ABS5BNN6_9BACT|nr:hypothetical protein [Gemmata palustris]MBP3955298.1 hypothetical protein [Gemmata palustris]